MYTLLVYYIELPAVVMIISYRCGSGFGLRANRSIGSQRPTSPAVAFQTRCGRVVFCRLQLLLRINAAQYYYPLLPCREAAAKESSRRGPTAEDTLHFSPAAQISLNYKSNIIFTRTVNIAFNTATVPRFYFDRRADICTFVVVRIAVTCVYSPLPANNISSVYPFIRARARAHFSNQLYVHVYIIYIYCYINNTSCSYG